MSDVRCTADEIRLLRPLDEMASATRLALTRWLWDHEIAPGTVALGLGVERDTVQNLVVWREVQPGGVVLKRWRFAAHDGLDPWPAPFPSVLVEASARDDVGRADRSGTTGR